MQELILKPCNPRGKYLRINLITVEWDRSMKALAAIVMFHKTWDRSDNKPLGVKLYADNYETMCKMLQEFNLLYPVRERTVIGIPEPGESRVYSHTGCTHFYIEDV